MEHIHANANCVFSNIGDTSISNYCPHQYHLHCCHELKYCNIYDIVYCTLCGKEWRNNSGYYYPYTYPYSYPYAIAIN